MRIAVTGTGTGVGKSYVTQLLRSALPSSVALKPIESGFDESACDARRIEGGPSWVRPLYTFAEPLSPHLLAARHGVNIDLVEVVRWVEEQSARVECAIVETAGGVFTPLDYEGGTNLSLVRRLEPCAWVLVAPNRLGVLHDVMATLVATRGEHRGPDAIVLSAAQPDASTALNAGELRRLLRATPPIFELEPGGDDVRDLLALLVGRMR